VCCGLWNADAVTDRLCVGDGSVMNIWIKKLHMIMYEYEYGYGFTFIFSSNQYGLFFELIHPL